MSVYETRLWFGTNYGCITKNNVKYTLSLTTEDRYKKNIIMYILSSTKQNIDCPIRNQTNYQFYKKKQNKRSVVQAETKQRSVVQA